MLSRLCCGFLAFNSLVFCFTGPCLHAQESPSSSAPPTAPATPANVVQAPVATTAPATNSEQISVPTGTRLPLMLRNGINTRTAKAGDSVYFETAYPIAQNNRIVIPMGSFVRGRILESKRPGLVKGRGEFRMLLDQMTFPNGYTVSLAATPASTDRDGKEGVDAEGKIVGPSGSGRDKMLLLATTTGGGFIGTLAGVAASGAPVRGALIGGGVGAAAGLISILLTRGPEAELPLGTMMEVVFDHALVLDADHLPANDPGKLSQPLVPANSQRQSNRRDRFAGRTPLGFPFPFLPF
jgi:hypothetical protein